jgi:hypothetical protein
MLNYFRSRLSSRRETVRLGGGPWQALRHNPINPAELIIVDASEDSSTRAVCEEQTLPGFHSVVSWCRADVPEAATQCIAIRMIGKNPEPFNCAN